LKDSKTLKHILHTWKGFEHVYDQSLKLSRIGSLNNKVQFALCPILSGGMKPLQVLV